MNSEESTAFKKLIKPMIDLAIEQNGGHEHIKNTYYLMPAICDFIAGWVARSYWIWLQGALRGRGPSQEEIRRIYDLVRLRIESESSTS